MCACADRLTEAAVRLLHDPNPTRRELEAVAHLLGAAATSDLIERLSAVAGRPVQERVAVCRGVHTASVSVDHVASHAHRWRGLLRLIRRQRGLT